MFELKTIAFLHGDTRRTIDGLNLPKYIKSVDDLMVDNISNEIKKVVGYKPQDVRIKLIPKISEGNIVYNHEMIVVSACNFMINIVWMKKNEPSARTIFRHKAENKRQKKDENDI